MSQENVEIVRQFYESVGDRQDLDGVFEIASTPRSRARLVGLAFSVERHLQGARRGCMQFWTESKSME